MLISKSGHFCWKVTWKTQVSIIPSSVQCSSNATSLKSHATLQLNPFDSVHVDPAHLFVPQRFSHRSAQCARNISYLENWNLRLEPGWTNSSPTTFWNCMNEATMNITWRRSVVRLSREYNGWYDGWRNLHLNVCYKYDGKEWIRQVWWLS